MATNFKCDYYHEICSRCIEWPDPDAIEADRADDCCMRHEIAISLERQEEISKSGKCEHYVEF